MLGGNAGIVTFLQFQYRLCTEVGNILGCLNFILFGLNKFKIKHKKNQLFTSKFKGFLSGQSQMK